MSGWGWFFIGWGCGLASFALAYMALGMHRHQWGPWSRVKVNIAVEGYSVTKQIRACARCNRQKVRGL